VNQAIMLLVAPPIDFFVQVLFCLVGDDRFYRSFCLNGIYWNEFLASNLLMSCSNDVFVLHGGSQGCFLHGLAANDGLSRAFVGGGSASCIKIGAGLVRFFLLGQTVDHFGELHDFLGMLVLEGRPFRILALIRFSRLVKLRETTVNKVLAPFQVGLAPVLVLVNAFVGHSLIDKLLLVLK
jgi:hypothetical protein